MQRMRFLAFSILVLTVLSTVCAGLVILALNDIHAHSEPSLVTEWTMVRIGFMVMILFHCSVLCILLRFIRFARGSRVSRRT
jgi:hypothetical protein